MLSQLEWAAGWLELYRNRAQLTFTDKKAKNLQDGVQLLSKVHSDRSFAAAAMTLVTELASYLQCDRVSLGIPDDGNKKDKVTVKALSHSAQFAKKQNLISAISDVMTEALLLGQEINYNLGNEADSMINDHHLLANEFNSSCILTLPIYAGDKYLVVLTFERAEEKAFQESEVDYCRSVLALIAPALEDKRLNDRSLPVKCKDALLEQYRRFVSPKYTVRKIIAAIALILVLFFTFATGTFKITADTKIEGSVQRVMAAPFSGYIKSADYRAGDIIKQGTVIAELDDRDIRMERLKFVSQQSQYQKQHQSALAQHDRAEANVFKAQLAQANAQLELVENQLQRAQLKSPFDAIIIQGDLSQKLGAAVEQGDELFLVAPLDNYRIILEVDERRITFVDKGQPGKMVLSSLPDRTFNFIVTAITPATEAKEGKNVFRVEAELVDGAEFLRPGMQGIGKIEVGEDKLFTIWTRGFVEWWQLWLWKWLP